MKPNTYPTVEKKKENNVILHIDSVEATLQNKPYIVSAVRSSKYSKLDKAQKREERKLKKELSDYTKYTL